MIMTKDEISMFRSGYDECRQVIIRNLKTILGKCSGKGVKAKLCALICQLEADAEREHWKQIQEEFPGITPEEYESEMNATFDLIREKYYSEHGYLKPRLVHTQKLTDE